MKLDLIRLVRRFGGATQGAAGATPDGKGDERARRLAEALGVTEGRAAVAARLFQDEWYRRHAGLGPADDAFSHFLAAGGNAASPGPLVARKLRGGAFADWVRSPGAEAPGPWFDAGWYLENNRDVRAAGADAVSHFLLHGSAEGRSPCKAFEPLKAAMALRGATSSTPHADLLSLAPDADVPALRKREVWRRARTIVQPRFLACQAPEAADRADDAARDWFFAFGVFEGVRPTPLFNQMDYRAAIDAACAPEEERPRPRRNLADPISTAKPLPTELRAIPDGVSPFLHWMFVGAPRRIVPTSVFDEAYYWWSNGDLRAAKTWLFEHYIESGVAEGHRRASPVFDPVHWRRVHGGVKSVPPLVACVAGDDGTISSPALGVRLPAGELPVPRDDSRLERVARALASTARRLDRSETRDAVARAAAIEPLILKPNGPRRIHAAPIAGSANALGAAAADLRRSLQRTAYDTVVLIPHCRMSGATHVGGEMVKALTASRPGESLLLVQTELSDFERPDWFGDSYDRLDFSALAVGLAPADRAALLIDLIRGVAPSRVINVNSRLGWDLYENFGERLARRTRLYAYLFCYDIDPSGNKVGYPIQSFQRAADALAGVFIDNSRLARELVERYRMPRAARDRLHVLYTPEDPSDLDLSGVFARRRVEGAPLRALWAGRLDRQKRFDIVIEIARLMPELRIDAYGKTVLGDFDLRLDDLPPSIRMCDPYKHIEEVPLGDYDLFLYTSEWDGLPSILIETAMRGMTIVASDTGGIDDLITDETGWPVRDALTPAAYVDALRDAVARPDEAGRRAAAVKRNVTALCDNDRYRADLLRALGEVE